MKALKLIFLSLVVLCSSEAMCASSTSTGKITKMRQFATNYDNNFWAPGEYWVTLAGVTSGTAGGCGSYEGSVLFVGSNQSTYSLLLAAYMASREVFVVWDDLYTKSGLCIIRLVTI